MIQLISLLASASMALGTVDTSLQIRNVNGDWIRPFAAHGNATVVFFMSTECPISRFYATEIQRICSSSKARGVTCSLIYEDLPVTPPVVRKHLAEFGYRAIPAAIDETGKTAIQSKVLVTPTAVIVDKAGQIRYRGRIDNFYAELGTPRRQATVHDLKDALDAVLTGRPVAHPETKAVGCFITSPEVLNKLQSEGGR